MTALICPRCRHTNPHDARYCHHDGVLLEGVKEIQKSITEFPTPFVFKCGLTCNNFKSLGQGILSRWDDSREMLAFAEWEGFFIGLGRNDLAHAATQARLFPDPDRGLDQLIAALPGYEAKPGILRTNQKILNFGSIVFGTQITETILLENDGDRLVWGEAILRDTPWCSLSVEGPLANRSFKFIKCMPLDIQIQSVNIRRSGRQLTGTLILKTDSVEVSIQLIAREPEVIPFEGELFSGATTPRELAEKSKIKPREAAPLFLSGKVANWYESNGWIYPVTGPTAPGMASVQQYFEAHGFAPAPKVDIEPQMIKLQSVPGNPATKSLILKTTEKRHVFGYLLPTETWIQAGALEASYQTAIIPLEFDTTKLSQESPLVSIVTVIANGQQRFDIPVEIHAIPTNNPLQDHVTIDTSVDELESIELFPVELMEQDTVEESILVEASIVNTCQHQTNEHSKYPNTNNLSKDMNNFSNSQLSASHSEFANIDQSNFQSSQSTVKNPNESFNTNNTACDATDSKNLITVTKNDTNISQKSLNKKKIILIGSSFGIILVLIVSLFFVWGSGNHLTKKQLVRPISAGKSSTDLLGFSIETTDKDHVSLLATESADTGSHFMLKSGNSTATVNTKKSNAKTVSKWTTKDGWSHREIDILVGGYKWRVGQWLRTMPDSPNQCAVLFELSPLERDLKISARLAMRPGTGNGTSVTVMMPDSNSPFKKPVLLRKDKFPEKLLFSIESPPIEGLFGFELPELLLPGREEPIVPSRPTQLLVGNGLDSFVPWDCQFPEFFADTDDKSQPSSIVSQTKANDLTTNFNDPFISIYWDDATVRKGQKRVVGFTLGVANQESVK